MLLPFCLVQPQWVNSQWPCHNIWGQISGWTLAQVMTCSLAAPSHHQNQGSLISEVQWLSPEDNFSRAEFHSYLPRANELKCTAIINFLHVCRWWATNYNIQYSPSKYTSGTCPSACYQSNWLRDHGSTVSVWGLTHWPLGNLNEILDM